MKQLAYISVISALIAFRKDEVEILIVRIVVLIKI